MGNAYIEILDNVLLSREHRRENGVNTSLVGNLGGQIPGPAPKSMAIGARFIGLRGVLIALQIRSSLCTYASGKLQVTPQTR